MTTSFALVPPTTTDRRVASTVAVIGSMLIALYPVGAGDGLSRLSVGAFVQPAASFNTRAAPETLEVSSDDVARGFVDVATPTQLEVRSNSNAGYLINVLPRTDLFAQVQVRGLDSRVELGADGGAVVRRWNGMERRQLLSLTYRFALRAGVQPGRYPWPLQLDIAPL